MAASGTSLIKSALQRGRQAGRQALNRWLLQCELAGAWSVRVLDRNHYGAMMTQCAKMRCKGPGPHYMSCLLKQACRVVPCWLVGSMRKAATIALLCAACHKLARCYTAHEPQSLFVLCSLDCHNLCAVTLLPNHPTIMHVDSSWCLCPGMFCWLSC